jgi:CubicO group peptidase (beta-lactamase class C family)
MSRAELSYSLREDDFLFIKLGNLKLRCSPASYAEPDAAARARAAVIKAVVEARFGDAIRRRGEPRFAFVDRIARVPEGFQPPPRRAGDGPWYLYSYFGSYGDPLADVAPDSYPDGLLARLSECGVNGVWLHVVLRQLAPGGIDFPEFGAGCKRRLANLRKLVDRAHRFGIDVYLYVNEPRAMPEAFFSRWPDMAGVLEGDHRALCTSNPRVRDWMSNALAHVYREVPGLGGGFTITASENLTNCASHGQQAGCPRCKGRKPAEIIAEVNAVIAAGIHRGSPQAKVLAWDWGGPGSDAIGLLPRDVWLMSASEWSLPIERGGVKNTVGEYSLSAPGPGPRATAHWKLAREHGLKTAAKLQRLALAAWIHFESVANQARFILARDAGRRDAMARIAASEARIARGLYDLTLDDSRIGFEASNQYYYMPLDLVEKVVNCEAIAAGLVDTKAGLNLTSPRAGPASTSREYFPPPESEGGWRTLSDPDSIRRDAGMDPDKLSKLRQWLRQSDGRQFAAVVIRRGYLVMQEERGKSAVTDSGRVASCSKAICATVLAIASEESQKGHTPRKMTFGDRAFEFIPWAQPLSDPRKARITVKQLLNHTSGICPEATGAPIDGKWDFILGHTDDARTASLAFDPETGCGYSTHALDHAALVCENVTGKPYDRFAIEALFKPLGIEHWWFQYYDGGPKYGRHPSHALGMSARDMARIAYCMAHGGRWNGRQVIPRWFVDQTAAPTHDVRGLEMRFRLNAQTFSHGWELPARLTGEGGRIGRGIPADARSKPGSGGQLIAFVPSLDLVVTRQTGGSGEWLFEEFLRRACEAVIDAR